jgi:hypothetical protein
MQSSLRVTPAVACVGEHSRAASHDLAAPAAKKPRTVQQPASLEEDRDSDSEKHHLLDDRA